MIKAVIIDDESGARFMLSELIAKKFANRIKIVGEADGIAEGEQTVRNHQPDLVFLDIKMQDGTGFELLERFEELTFEVIFVTAYNNFAIKAFEFSAFGYLLKPIKSSDFIKTVEKLEKRFSQLKASKKERFKVLIDNYANNEKVKKLVITKAKGFEVVHIDKIICLEGDGNYTHIQLLDGKKITSSKNLKQFESLLLDLGFFRIHISTLINLSFVKGYSSKNGGEVEMCDGSLLKISRYRKAEFLNRFY